MNQKETGENIEENTGAADSREETASERNDAGEIDNLPVESIGSYARVEELLTDEEADETTAEK